MKSFTGSSPPKDTSYSGTSPAPNVKHRSNIFDSARDGQQRDLLLRKYFHKGDIYVHSDLENSTLVIIKNPLEQQVVPPGTLSQAGVMAVATSRAWDVKQGTPCSL